MCGLGYTVAGSPTNFFFASDLLHRVYHVPKISEGIVQHYSEDYAGVLSLAMTEPGLSVKDSDALQYFALDAYAFDVAVPGVGCSGRPSVEEETEGSATSSAATSSAEASSTVAAAVTSAEVQTSTAPPSAAEAVETGTATSSATQVGPTLSLFMILTR